MVLVCVLTARLAVKERGLPCEQMGWVWQLASHLLVHLLMVISVVVIISVAVSSSSSIRALCCLCQDALPDHPCLFHAPPLSLSCLHAISHGVL